MNVELALLADYAAVTNEGKLVAAGIFDLLRPPALPWQHPTMFIALRIHFHPGEEGPHKVDMRLVDPDGAEMVSLQGEADVAKGDPLDGANIQMVLSLNNIPFKATGRHAFDVFLDGRYEHTIPLRVMKVDQATDSPTEG